MVAWACQVVARPIQPIQVGIQVEEDQRPDTVDTAAPMGRQLPCITNHCSLIFSPRIFLHLFITQLKALLSNR